MPTLVTRNAPLSPALESRRVRGIADRMLTSLGQADAELSVLLTSDELIHELNRRHRGVDRPTDVLAFPQSDERERVSEHVAATSHELLGDVVISLDTAAKQAKNRGHGLLDEVRFLLAHGILHLVGYDHQNDDDEAEMNEMTRRLVSASTPLPRRRASS